MNQWIILHKHFGKKLQLASTTTLPSEAALTESRRAMFNVVFALLGIAKSEVLIRLSIFNALHNCFAFLLIARESWEISVCAA